MIYDLGDMLYVIAVCLGLTVVIECALSFILGYRKTDLLYILLVNAITNPLLNSSAYLVEALHGEDAKGTYVMIAEFVVVVIEGLIYLFVLDRRKINPMILSFILNLVSCVLGYYLVNYVIF